MNVTVTDQKVTKVRQNFQFRELCVDVESAMVNQPDLEWNTLEMLVLKWKETFSLIELPSFAH